MAVSLLCCMRTGNRVSWALRTLLLLSCWEGAAQPGSPGFDPGEPFRRRVLTIESFIYRFNHEEDELGNNAPPLAGSPDTAAWVAQRHQAIRGLFDPQRLNDPEDGLRQRVDSFAAGVNAPGRQRKLGFYDRDWYAEVRLDVRYKQKPQQLTLLLQVEQTQPEVSRWVVRAVKADFLDFSPKVPDSSRIIPPNSHDNDFVGVPRDLADPGAIGHFTAREVQLDVLSLFLYAVYHRELVLKKTTGVTFHFLQLDGWIVRVAERGAEGTPGGWGVEELIPADPSAKRRYAAQRLNLR